MLSDDVVDQVLGGGRQHQAGDAIDHHQQHAERKQTPAWTYQLPDFWQGFEDFGLFARPLLRARYVLEHVPHCLYDQDAFKPHSLTPLRCAECRMDSRKRLPEADCGQHDLGLQLVKRLAQATKGDARHVRFTTDADAEMLWQFKIFARHNAGLVLILKQSE